MNFLGREQVPVVVEATPLVGGERNVEQRGAGEECEGTGPNAVERQTPNTYAGVVVFCIPTVAEIGKDIDTSTFRVHALFANMFVYGLGLLLT